MQTQRRPATFYAPAIKASLGLILLWLLRTILIRLPMIRDLTIPDVQFTGPAFVKIIVAILMIVVLVNFGREFGPKLRSGVHSLPEAGAILDSLIYIACVVLVYDALTWPAQLLLKQDSWIYHWIFLALIIPGIYRVVVAFYKSIDDITALLTRGYSRTEDEVVPCAACSQPNPITARFCSRCGTTLGAATPVSKVWCPKCEAENPPEAAFCTTCGAKLA